MRGVAAAHRQGVVHRDLKPDNIFLAYEEDGVRRDAKVLDFGISKISNDNQTNLRLTRTGAVVGTPYYMSPEQIRGSATLDKRADIYSIGVILYESLSGQVPFQAETYGELVIEVATGTAKPLDVLVPNLPAELSRIVLRSMARDMNQRYPSMESLISALEPFISSNAPRSSRPSVTSGEQQRASIPLDPRDSSPSVNTKPSTKPHLAATPFAAEHEADPFKRRGTMVGMSAFAVAAVVLVGGIWFFTREREPTETLVMPAQAEQPLVPTAAAQPPAPALAEPGMASPMPSGTATALANDPPSAPGSDVNTAPAAPDSVPVHGVSAPSSRMRGNSDSSSKRQRGSRKRGDAHDGASAIDSAPLRVDSVSPPPAARRARSGKLNVDEF
jgi:serine/threonine-protein kinase